MLEKGEESTRCLYGRAISEPIIGGQQIERKNESREFMGTENWMEKKSKNIRKGRGNPKESTRPCMKRANLYGRA